MNGATSITKLSARAWQSLFEERALRGHLNEDWFGEIHARLDAVENDAEYVVRRTEAALIYALAPAENLMHRRNIDFSFRIFNEFEKRRRAGRASKILFYMDYDDAANAIETGLLKIERRRIRALGG